MGILNKIMNVTKVDDIDDYEDNEYYNDVDTQRPKSRTSSRFFNEANQSLSNSITPIDSRRSSMQVKVIKPINVDENSREIVDTLKNNCTILLNLEGLDIDIAQRIIDFTSGACSALDGNFRKISTFIFLITPKSVGISGDMADIITSTFDVSDL